MAVLVTVRLCLHVPTVISNLSMNGLKKLLSLPLPSPVPLAGEKRQPENIQIIEKKKTLIISKQINKAMTKQYIYIYRYKKKKK